jgi:hypothetical protein
MKVIMKTIGVLSVSAGCVFLSISSNATNTMRQAYAQSAIMNVMAGQQRQSNPGSGENTALLQNMQGNMQQMTMASASQKKILQNIENTLQQNHQQNMQAQNSMWKNKIALQAGLQHSLTPFPDWQAVFVSQANLSGVQVLSIAQADCTSGVGGLCSIQLDLKGTLVQTTKAVNVALKGAGGSQVSFQQSAGQLVNYGVQAANNNAMQPTLKSMQQQVEVPFTERWQTKVSTANSTQLLRTVATELAYNNMVQTVRLAHSVQAHKQQMMMMSGILASLVQMNNVMLVPQGGR